jgi:hypothetical protein
MMPWRILWKTEALILAVLVGCSATPRVIRVETGAGGETIVHIPRTDTVEPVAVTPEETTQAIRRLAREVRLSGSPRGPGVGAPIASRAIVWGARLLAGSTWTCKAATCWPWP